MRRPTARAALLALAAVVVGAAGAAVLYSFDPTAHGFYPRCPFFVLTGLQCPGCGTARALHQLLHGNVVAAFGYNPFLFLSAPVVLLFAVSPGCRRSAGWGRAFLLAALVWWVVRNLA